MPLRLLLYIVASNPLQVLLVQSLEGLDFGIMGILAITFVNDTATDTHRGAAQARLAGVSGLALALGPIMSGWIAEHFGFAWMFATMSIVGMAGAGVFLTRVEESHPAPAPLAERGPVFLQPIRILAAPLG